MFTISRTRTPDDFSLDSSKFIRTVSATDSPSAKPQRVPQSVQASRSGSMSTTSTDPFADLAPWEALFESNIWAPETSVVEAPTIPSDISRRYSQSVDVTSVAELDEEDVSRVLDPTSIEFGFQHSYLGGLDDRALFSPIEAFASQCWESAVASGRESPEEPVQPFSLGGDLTSILEMDEDSPPSPAFTDRVYPLVVPISASLLWSDDSDSDSDECQTYEDHTPMPSIREKGQLSVLPAPGYSPELKEKSFFYKDLTTSFGAFEPIFPLSDKEHIGQSPIPIKTTPSKSMSQRMVDFYHARLSHRVAGAIAR